MYDVFTTVIPRNSELGIRLKLLEYGNKAASMKEKFGN